MGFAVFFFIIWLTSAIFFIMQKQLSIVENTFVYLIILIVNLNWIWIIFEELKFINITDVAIDYTAFVLNRSITIPLIFVLHLNFLQKSSTFARIVLTTAASLSILVFLTGLSTYFNITNYVKWNLGFDILYFLALHLIAFYTLQFLRRFTSSGVSYS